MVQGKGGTATTLGGMCFYSKEHFEAVTIWSIRQNDCCLTLASEKLTIAVGL